VTFARGAPEDTGAEAWSAVERALLDSALDFYGAAEGVIDLAGEERPRVRHDIARLEAVGEAMATLEQRVREAREHGVTTERIAEIARLEPEMVAAMLERERTPAPPESAER
jgi:hypothetical protein